MYLQIISRRMAHALRRTAAIIKDRPVSYLYKPQCQKYKRTYILLSGSSTCRQACTYDTHGKEKREKQLI